MLLVQSIRAVSTPTIPLHIPGEAHPSASATLLELLLERCTQADKRLHLPPNPSPIPLVRLQDRAGMHTQRALAQARRTQRQSTR